MECACADQKQAKVELAQGAFRVLADVPVLRVLRFLVCVAAVCAPSHPAFGDELPVHLSSWYFLPRASKEELGYTKC